MMGLYYRIQEAIQSWTAILVILGGIAGIFGILFFSIFVIKKINKNLAIMISAFVSCVLMIPVISSFNNLVRINVEGGIIDEARAEIRAQWAESARLQAEIKVMELEQRKLDNETAIASQTIEVQTLNDNIKQLENAQLSMQSFQRILQLALLETNLKQTLVRPDRIGPVRGWGLIGYNFSQVLSITDHDITAKFGIDLNEIRVEKLNDTAMVVSGIQPKFIGTSRYITKTILSEMRRVDVRGGQLTGGELTGGIIDRVRVENDRINIQRANQLTEEFRIEFQRKLSEGLELGFMNDAVVRLAQNFITVMLAPLFRNITFDNNYRPDALPLMEYLERELREANARRLELTEANNKKIQENMLLENDIKNIENSILENGESL